MTAVTKDSAKPRSKRPRAEAASKTEASTPAVQVSVIVPARNEEERLPYCLGSLVSQWGIPFEIIVVDDHSTDRTAEIAGVFCGVKLVQARALPEGWCGKSNALHTGVQHAHGKWLLFTDADTVHAPGSLARAIAEAEAHGADLLSYSPAQEVESFWEHAVMPVIFADLAETYRPGEVCDPDSPAAAANGQYLLIRRTAYDAVGGLAACPSTLLEDVELARRVKQAGGRLRFRFGGDAVRTRMYRNFGELREGWTKNLALLFPDARYRATQRGGEFALIAAAAATSLLALRGGRRGVALVSGAVAALSYANFLRRIRGAHFGPRAEIAALAGLPVFAYLLARSELHYSKGKAIAWRGRDYRPRTNSEIEKLRNLENEPVNRAGAV